MAQFDLRPKLDGSLQITKFCVMIFCGSIATWFQPLPNPWHSSMRQDAGVDVRADSKVEAMSKNELEELVGYRPWFNMHDV